MEAGSAPLPRAWSPDLVVIPARLGSERLPRKALALVDGLPLVERVRRNAIAAWPDRPVVVACDGEELRQVVAAHGGRAVVVPEPVRTGSDRVAAILDLFPEASLVLNLQGDEAGLGVAHLRSFLERAATHPAADIWTPVVATTETPSGVYAVEHQLRALYFSRAALPIDRGGAPRRRWLHRGAYLYRREALLGFAAAASVEAEEAERLEQLRALALGLHIQLVPISSCPSGIDTPADLKRWAAGVPA